MKFIRTLRKVFFGKESEKPTEEKRWRRQVERNQVSSPNPSLNLSSCGFIVIIVGEMVTRKSLASRGRERRDWRRSGLTRIGTTLPMVYLSLVCHCPGARRL
jgi:hypothetical protein